MDLSGVQTGSPNSFDLGKKKSGEKRKMPPEEMMATCAGMKTKSDLHSIARLVEMDMPGNMSNNMSGIISLLVSQFLRTLLDST